VKVTFKLYASLGSFLPAEARKTSRIELDLPEGTTVLQAILGQGVPPERCSLVLINGVFVSISDRAHQHLREGDSLAIWPPVAGG
jgi:sulfur carrier protein ThiS